MLLSMTGFGEGSSANERLAVSVEVRSVNNRHLKITTRCPDSYLTLESEVEKIVRRSITRGTVTVHVRIDRLAGQSPYTLDVDAVSQYWTELRQAADRLHLAPPADLSPLLALPGVVSEDSSRSLTPEDGQLVHNALETALTALGEFRVREGQAMRDELEQQCLTIEKLTDGIRERAPQIVEAYRTRLLERVNDLIRSSNVDITDADIVREVSLFADRCDITEELTRLHCHIDQFRGMLDSDASMGRRLEFLCQEMFREINTIGSKANDVEIAHTVVDVKASIEKIREIVQNVE
ncbi:YicC/YloC family endoribonuclease [Maioricimonas sp. JC845]|uniref:YicC/YloC family endoribonuclease n=1 Tax=Maioricimonas sp. JC845 TaxID=3232138 RepID=UPI0034584AB6